MRLIFQLSRPAAASLAALAIASFTGCHKQQEAAAPTQEATTSAPMVSDAMLRLPAVKGNPAAAYFTLTNSTSAGVSLTSVAIDGAGRAELHETVGDAMKPLSSLVVPAGQSASFSSGGKHVMVFGVGPSLTPGATGRITLYFADGSKVSAPLKVQTAAGDDGMAGMKM